MPTRELQSNPLNSFFESRLHLIIKKLFISQQSIDGISFWGFALFNSAPDILIIAPIIHNCRAVMNEMSYSSYHVFLHKKIILLCYIYSLWLYYLGVFYLILFHCLSGFFNVK